jgi:hypothetical protein
MDTFHRMRYTRMHETSRHCSAVGTPKAPGHGSAEVRQDLPIHRFDDGNIVEFGRALASVLPQAWTPRASGSTDSWPATPAIGCPEAADSEASGTRPSSSRLPNRRVDVKTDCRGNRQAVRGGVSPLSHLEIDAGSRLELPEAAEASPGAQRGGDRLLEEVRVAPYKKRPQRLGPIWSSSMKADSCSSPMLPGLGLRGERLQICSSQGVGPSSRPSRLSASPRSESVWPCMRGSIPTRTSGPLKWPISFGISCATSWAQWSCSGTEGAPIKPDSFNISWTAILACTRIPSRPMRLSSTRTSLSGPSLSARWPTAFLKTWIISGISCGRQCADSAAPSSCSGRAFTLPICRGHDGCIHFLGKHQ